MIQTDESQSGAVYGLNLPKVTKEDNLNHLTMDMTGLNLSLKQNDISLAKTYSDNHKSHNGAQSNWFSGLVESCGSCETSNTYMYDSLNSHLSNDKLSYSQNATMSGEMMAPDDLTLSSLNLPLFNYNPTYNIDSDKLTDFNLHSPLNDSALPSTAVAHNPQIGSVSAVCPTAAGPSAPLSLAQSGQAAQTGQSLYSSNAHNPLASSNTTYQASGSMGSSSSIVTNLSMVSNAGLLQGNSYHTLASGTFPTSAMGASLPFHGAGGSGLLKNSQHLSSLSSDSLSHLDAPKFGHRKAVYHSGESYVFLKILATQLVSGTIIGRGGKGLNWFRRKSKVDDIVLSMPWELYPKTEYRTLLLKGSLKSVIKSTCIIAELMNSRYSLLSDSSMMVMVVLPEVFLNAMDEIKRTTNPNLLSITLFRDENAQHQEIVAVLKGDKSKVKDLVAAISTSITETIAPEKYCFVSYPNSEYFGYAQTSDSGSEIVKRNLNTSYSGSSNKNYSGSVKDYTSSPVKEYSSSPVKDYSNSLKTHARDDIDSLLNQIENAVDNGNLATISRVSTLIKLKPELLSRTVEVQITLQNALPDDLVALANLYKCDLQQTDSEDGNVQCKITGQFAGCFATLLFIFIKSPDLDDHV